MLFLEPCPGKNRIYTAVSRDADSQVTALSAMGDSFVRRILSCLCNLIILGCFGSDLVCVFLVPTAAYSTFLQ